MANGLLRNIAVTLGAAVADGIARNRSLQVTRPAPSTFSPILTRLAQVENRVTHFEILPAPIAAPSPDEIQALGTLVSCQSEEIAVLREDIHRLEQRNAEQVEAFGSKVAQLEREVPLHIESCVFVRMAELEQRVRSEFQAVHHRTVDAFAEAIEDRVIGRINALENSLIEQSQAITTLREKSLHTDDNLQRLLGAVEKLCARAEAQSQVAMVQPDPAPQPPQPDAVRHSDQAPPLPQAAETQLAPELLPDLETELEPELAYAAAVRSARASERSGRRGWRPAGMAILGFVVLGLRLLQ